MKNFSYAVAKNLDDAFVADGSQTVAIAGGTELLNWFRLGIAAPERVIDIGRISGLSGIEQRRDGLWIGALATLNDVGGSALVARHAQVLRDACHSAASAQIRNRATLGGNVLQKTRCPYFRAEAPLPWGCNKRNPGSGCAAREGLNERMALFGWTDDCVAVQPSDPLVALVALGAEVEIHGPRGERRLPIAQLHLTPEEAAAELDAGRLPVSRTEIARVENRLLPGEIIAAYVIPIREDLRSAYVKVRERASYEYALVSAAAALTLVDGKIASAAVVLGSVAMKPWRLPEAEKKLSGLGPDRDAVLPVIRDSLAAARPLAHNAFKIAMAAGAATRAIVTAGAHA
jgi:xanthine dehydrogenase YagS FAD-binding subunit